MKKSNKKTLITAIIGAPNAGKSTLLNNIIGNKISIVSPKIQTTRTVVRGIHIEKNTQMVFVDTPGIFDNPKRRLEKSIVRSAMSSFGEADEIIMLIDAKKGICQNVESILQKLQKNKKKIIIVFNKIDVVTKETLLPIIEEISNHELVKKVFLISALKNDGVQDLLDYLDSQAHDGDWLFPEDQITDAPSKFIASEITREKLFLSLQKELPYEMTVETELWEEREDGSIKINQIIYVTKEGQKKIIIGKAGNNIKHISTSARRELQEIFDKKIHLFLFVKVRPNWMDNPEMFNNMGLEFIQ